MGIFESVSLNADGLVESGLWCSFSDILLCCSGIALLEDFIDPLRAAPGLGGDTGGTSAAVLCC